MIDIKFLRENPDIVKENIKKKFQDHKLVLVDEVRDLDEKNREVKLKGDELRMQRNSLSSQIGVLMKENKKSEAEEIKKKVQKINSKLEENEKLEEKYKTGLDAVINYPSWSDLFCCVLLWTNVWNFDGF